MDSIKLALQIRKDVLRMTHRARSSHVGCALSIADVLAVLYSDILNIDYKEKTIWDKFILSKGHAGSALYSVLANIGFIPKESLNSYCENGSALSGHVSHQKIPMIQVSTGSLGHGGSIACGLALSMKMRKCQERVFVLLGDGECNEGSVWEMALFAAHHQLDNFCAIIDYNKLQGLGFCKDVMSFGDFSSKWKAFGWSVYEVDGHNHLELKEVFKKERVNRPVCIIAETVKGQGVSFMENNLAWHYKSLNEEELERALEELEKRYEESID